MWITDEGKVECVRKSNSRCQWKDFNKGWNKGLSQSNICFVVAIETRPQALKPRWLRAIGQRKCKEEAIPSKEGPWSSYSISLSVNPGEQTWRHLNPWDGIQPTYPISALQVFIYLKTFVLFRRLVNSCWSMSPKGSPPAPSSLPSLSRLSLSLSVPPGSSN